MINNNEFKTYLVPKKYQRILIVNSGSLKIKVNHGGSATVFMKNSKANTGNFDAQWSSKYINAPNSIASVDRSITIKNDGVMTIHTEHPTQVLLKQNNGTIKVVDDTKHKYVDKTQHKNNNAQGKETNHMNKDANKVNNIKGDKMSNNIRKTITIDDKAKNGNHIKKVTKIDDKGNALVDTKEFILSKNRTNQSK